MSRLWGAVHGINFEQLVEFYQHEQNWTNRMILGDSLLVMTSLAEKEGLKGKVQTIFMDPPYGIKFGSNWQVSTRKKDVKDSKVEDTVRQPEQIKAFRDTWELGIHSYLQYLRDRIKLIRELLSNTGSVFLQIGDANLHLVRCILDEIFGAENFCKIIPFQKTSGQETNLIASTLDYILWYAKDKSITKSRGLFQQREIGEKSLDRYDMFLNNGKPQRLTTEQIMSGSIPNGYPRYQLSALYSEGETNSEQNFSFEGSKYSPRVGTHWKTTVAGLAKLAKAQRIEKMGTVIRYRRFAHDFPVIPITDRWDSVQLGTERNYVVETAPAVIARCILLSSDPGDTILDPTCGSGTSAYVAEQWGRRWITIDTSRVALALARTRIMAGRFPYYYLSDSTEGMQKEAELTGNRFEGKTSGDIRKGFVYQRVPHVTLKSIANNEEIDVIHDKFQPKQDVAREKLNKVLKKEWQEWEVPFECDSSWSDAAKKAHEEFLALKRDRQKEIDDSIAKRADQELLYDQPYEDKKRVRVAGPFTVESLSPHRFVSADSNFDGTITEKEARESKSFVSLILDNLKTAGVKTTTKGEGIKFERLEPYAGEWIHAEGTYTDKEGKSKRVAVFIGPEHSTVAPQHIKEAAKAAVQGVGFDVLVVCGFAFDPHCSEESMRYGKLQVMICRMNPDLAMGDELLKKTGSGNLFMVFGEPDISIKKLKNDQISVEIKGVDVYDPTTGQVRSNSTDDIACWFIDTNYNGESFFVRQAYFCGGNDPYEKLKRALKAEVDESAWAALYDTKSRHFDTPSTGKIAVKVINHYGDEVLKVVEVG